MEGMTREEFRRLRRLTGLTQEQCANQVLGVTARTVGRWESGATRINHLEAGEIRRRLAAVVNSGKGTAK